MVATFIRSVVDTFGSPNGLVPPPSFGGTGSTVHMRQGLFRPDRLFIHEIGHILDFALGTQYAGSDLDNNFLPSTMLMNETGGSYPIANSLGPFWDGIILDIGEWAVLITLTDVFNEGPFVSQYGGLNHYEYFAETWEAWVLQESGKVQNFTTLNPILADFMNDNLLDFLRFASIIKGTS